MTYRLGMTFSDLILPHYVWPWPSLLTVTLSWPFGNLILPYYVLDNHLYSCLSVCRSVLLKYTLVSFWWLIDLVTVPGPLGGRWSCLDDDGGTAKLLNVPLSTLICHLYTAPCSVCLLLTKAQLAATHRLGTASYRAAASDEYSC